MTHPFDARPVVVALADGIRRELVASRESFVFETVLSDPLGRKLAFLEEAVKAGYTVVLCFVGLDSARTSGERVAMRVAQGGHDVPPEKLRAHYPRTMRNLAAAIRVLPHLLVFDNSDLTRPFWEVARFDHGRGTAGETPPHL